MKTRCSVTDECNAFALKVNCVVPVGRMEESASIILDALVIRQLPCIEMADGVDDDIQLFFVGLDTESATFENC